MYTVFHNIGILYVYSIGKVALDDTTVPYLDFASCNMHFFYKLGLLWIKFTC